MWQTHFRVLVKLPYCCDDQHTTMCLSHLLPRGWLPCQGRHHRYSSIPIWPPDFFMFPGVKTQIKGRHFGQHSEGWHLSFKGENDYHTAFDAWKTHWNLCVDAWGMYFEYFWRVVLVEPRKSIVTSSLTLLSGQTLYRLYKYALC